MNLSDVLGITPLLQLVPKQDLAPLVSCSQIQPQALEPKEFLSDRAQNLLANVGMENGETSGSIENLMNRLSAKFHDFECPELDSVRFRRPVIAGESELQPQLPDLPEIYKKLAHEKDLIRIGDLVEFEGDLGTSVMTEELHLLDGSESSEQKLDHVAFYKRKFEKEINEVSKGKKRAFRDDSGMARMTRRRISLDRSKLNDSRLEALYNYLDNLTLELELQTDHEPVKSEIESVSNIARHINVSDANTPILTSVGLRNLKKLLSDIIETQIIGACAPDYLKEIQILCVNTIQSCPSKPKNSFGSNLGLTIDASALLLDILNTNQNIRELHMQSYIDCIVNSLAKTLPEFSASNTSDFMAGNVIDCLDKLSVQLGLNAADDRTLTQIEYMSVKAIFDGGESKASFQIRDAVAQTLCQIFKDYPTQRSFVINEVMTNISKITNKKGLSREAQLSNGAYVSPLAIFLVQIIENTDISLSKGDLDAFVNLPKNDNPNSAPSVKRVVIMSELSAIMDEATGYIQQVVDFFLNNISVANSNHKMAFMTLAEDLMIMMPLCEYPGAEFASSVIISELIAALQTQKVMASEEPFLLEILGVFASNFLDMKQMSGDFIVIGENLSTDVIAKLSKMHMIVVNHLRQQGSKHARTSEASQFQLLKEIKYYKKLYEESVRGSKESPYLTFISDSNKKLSDESLTITRIVDSHLALLVHQNPIHEAGYDDSSNSRKVYREVILATTFSPLYSEFLGLLTGALESPKIKLAAKAIRVLSPLIKKDPRILLNAKVNSSISRVLSSGSALSKDAVIDLLGQYMFSSEDHITKYHALIGERASDGSVSVRKRVMKIMRNVFERTDQIEVMTYACMKILLRLEDEESSIINTSKAALKAILFSSDKVADGTEVMIKLASSDGETRKLLMSLLRQYLRPAKLGGKVPEIMKQIFDEAFGRISESTEISDIHQKEASIGFAAALAECDPRLVSQDQLIALQPFFVGVAGEKDTVSLSALKILRSARLNIKTLRSEFVSNTNSILLKQLTKYKTKELHEAVQIVEEFSTFNSSAALTNAAISSLRLLLPHVSSGKRSIDSTKLPRIRKILHLLGCFASYCNLETSRESFLGSDLGLRASESVVSLMARYLLFFCRPDTEELIKATALSNLLHVAAHHPRLFLSDAVLNVLDTELQSSAQKPKLEIVRGLSLFLNKEEDKLVANSEEVKMLREITGSLHADFLGSGSINVADSVCPSVIQRYINPILSLCLQDASEVGEAAVLFLQVVTKLGYANPKLCIPTIIALQASPVKRIKKIGFELHSEIFEKHESLADRSYVDAIKLACDYSMRTEKLGHLHNNSFLRSVYCVVNSAYSAKKKFVLSTVRLFHVNFATDSLVDAIKQRDIAVYLAANLSVIDFTSMEEVYLVLHHLNGYMTGDVLDLAEKITVTIASTDGNGMSVPNLQLLVVFCQTALAFISLRQVLMASFGVRPGMMDGYRPNKPDMELRQPPKIVAFVNFPLEDLALDTKLSNPASFGSLFTRLVQSAKAFNSSV